MPRLCTRQSSGKSNVLAFLISATSLGTIFLNFDPAPAGEDIERTRPAVSQQEEVPLPPGISQQLPIVVLPDDTAQPAQQSSPSGVMLDNNEAIEFSLLLLQDGSRFLQNVDTYSVLFNKLERINGDLGENQTIEMKVRHEPTFSIYMKWKNGDTGRQVLYNEDYEDKKMVVKLGGFKGRLLPGIKLDPTGAEAMSEARYPVTEAGLLGMVKLLVMHRQNDLNHGQGVSCVRRPNRIFDERECYCFEFEYTRPDFNKTYRKSIVSIDTRYHIPLQVVNYTWTNETKDLSPEQIDEQTLVENYSFQRIDFGRETVAQEFSRENPAYRM